MRTILLLCNLSFLATTACTVVHVEGPPGGPGTSHVEIGRITPTNTEGVTAYRSEILGLGWGQRGLVLGWAREDAVLADDLGRCRIVIFELPPDRAEADKWRELIAGRPDICALKKGK